MYQYFVGYRHTNCEVEGFKGFGFTPKSAEADAFEQIRIKLTYYIGERIERVNFASLIENNNGLTAKEIEQLRQDWHSKARYVHEKSEDDLDSFHRPAYLRSVED
jgi:hypothetical protein